MPGTLRLGKAPMKTSVGTSYVNPRYNSSDGAKRGMNKERRGPPRAALRAVYTSRFASVITKLRHECRPIGVTQSRAD